MLGTFRGMISNKKRGTDVLPEVNCASLLSKSWGGCAVIVTEARLSTFTVFQCFWHVILKTLENPNRIF